MYVLKSYQENAMFAQYNFRSSHLSHNYIYSMHGKDKIFYYTMHFQLAHKVFC